MFNLCDEIIIQNYLIILNLCWINTYFCLTFTFFALPFSIFLLRQHFMTIPVELWESAQMDGCSRFWFYLRFALPLSKSSLSALAIYGFLTTWNKYLRSEEHTFELQSRGHLVCRLLLEKKKT